MSHHTRHAEVPGMTAARRRAGFALEMVLLLMVLFASIILAGLSTVSTIARTSSADYQAARATYAAEGASDDVMSQLDAAMQDGQVTAEDIAALTTPEIPGYVVTQATQAKGAPALRTVTTGPFTGLYSMNQVFEITVGARDSSRSRAGAVITVNAQSIPIFQFGVFYDQDLEFHPGPQMTFAGRVHTNGNLYTYNNVTFEGVLTTPESTFLDLKNAESGTNGVHIRDGGGVARKLDFDSRTHGAAAYRQRSEQLLSSRLMSKAHGVRPLQLPLPGNTPPFTLLLPRDPGDSELVRRVKMAWKADWYVTVRAGVFAMADTNAMKAAFCDSLVQLRPPGLEVPVGADCRRIFKPRVDAFLDGRENRRPDLVDIHLDSLKAWSDAAPATRAPRVLYVAFESLPSGTPGDLPAVRLRQGAELPLPRTALDSGGLTVATERPLYVLGDFNTGTWRPAALMGDAVIFLSRPPNPAMGAATSVPAAQRCGASGVRGWCDNQQQAMAVRGAQSTTQNAAVLAGHTPTSCDHSRAGCSAPVQGGGLHNMVNYRENWGSGTTHTYRGSIVSLFTHRYLTRPFSMSYYSPPTRVWSFETRFQQPSQLPPGTPAVGTVMQTAYRPVY
jgi:Tfp pilus assembly protein PilX